MVGVGHIVHVLLIAIGVLVVATVPVFFLVLCDIAMNSFKDYAMPQEIHSSYGVLSCKNPYPHRGCGGVACSRTDSSPSTSVTSTLITATTPLVIITTPITTTTITLPATSMELGPG